MTIEVALLISGVSLAFGIYTGLFNLKRNKAQDDKKEASDLTTVIVSLESIKDGIKEIKTEISNVKDEVREQRDNQIRLEESLKSAWKRIEIIEGKKGTGE